MSRIPATLFTVCLLLLFACFSAADSPNTRGRKEGNLPPGQDKKPAKDSDCESTEVPEEYSKKHVTGFFRLHIIGTGKQCLVKQKTKESSCEVQFGEDALTVAFIQLFGRPECKEGDKGNARGTVRAYVIAEAYRRGEECLASVIAQVIAESRHNPHHTDVKVGVGGFAFGGGFVSC